MNGIICCACSTLAISVLQFALIQRRNDLNKIQEKNRVTAKSRPMMNLIARTPSFVSSSPSVSPVKKHYGSQDPWTSVAGEDRSGRPDKGTDLFEASDHHRQQWIKNGRNLKRFRRGTKQKSETNLTCLMKQEKKVEKYTSRHGWTSVI